MEQMNLRSRFLLILGVTGILAGALAWQGIRLGQDLKGGTTLRFSLDLDRAESTGRIESGIREQVVSDTIKVIEERINKFGLAEITLTPVGEDKFEISLPAGSEGDVDSIVDLVTQLGDLKFRITVLPAGQYRDLDGETPPRLQQPGSYPWVGAKGNYEPTPDGFARFKKDEVKRFIDARDTMTLYEPIDPRYFVVPKSGSDASSPEDFVVLEEPADSKYRFDGRILKNPTVGQGQAGRPVVLYDVKTDYQNVFGEWTEANVGLPMAIVLNEEFYSDPQIRDKLTTSVQITLGSNRSYSEQKKEAEQIATVLQTGSLKVRPQLESRTKIGAKLAGQAKERGVMAIVVAFVLVLIFMIFYYRGMGVVADFALLLNLILLLGTLAFFKAVLTLPGIAGIVLTLGMAVDANILINERIREEIRAGRSLMRAISEGYDRALSAIIDANVTSIITAIFLYTYGSGPVRGFAITLAVGLAASMFTAIYVTRTILEWGLKSGRFTEVKMLGSGEPPRIGWVALRRYFAPLSALGVVFGLLVFGLEDRYTLYDVDFTGGFKLQARFDEPTTVDDVRDALRSGAREIAVETEEFNEDNERVKVTHRVLAGPYDKSEVVAVGTLGEGVEIIVQRGLDSALEGQNKAQNLEIQEKAFKAYVHEVLRDRLRSDWLQAPPRAFTAPSDADEELKAVDGGVHFRITMLDPEHVITPERLKKALAEAMPYWTMQGSKTLRNAASKVNRTVVVRPQESDNPALDTYDVWMKTTNKTTGDVIERDPTRLRAALAEFLGGRGLRASLVSQGAKKAQAESVSLSQPFPSADVIGSSVARRLKDDALIALALSLLGIIIYIAVRFRSRAMGLSAVICLFHDVSVTLGIVALANIYGIVDAKISLPMVAAFLTLIGYSVNDTVVIFDRIRENRGKKRTITPHMIDLSINQTLSRTIRTSITTLLAALALFVFNFGQRNVLEGFAFILIVGVLIGTYSTVAISSPLLLFLPWLWQRLQGIRPRTQLVTYVVSHVHTLVLAPVAVVLWLAWAGAFAGVAFVGGLVLFPVWALTVPVTKEDKGALERETATATSNA